MTRIPSTAAALLASTVLTTTGASAQERASYTLFGTPGLIEMPTARSAPDAEIAAQLSYWRLQQKGSFSFQLLPRLSGTFRYAGIGERGGPGTEGTFDRSFDLRYRILDEGDYTPALAIGVQDFLGTGLLSSEYIVASKQIGPVDVTAGIGWGRLGTRNGFTNPLGSLDASFETRDTTYSGLGGELETGRLFRGDAAFFGGVSYRYSDSLLLKAEYSSDAYATETALGTIDVRSPVNVGLSYTYMPGLDLDLAYLYGSEIAAGVTLTINPRVRPQIGGIETGPPPVMVRGANPEAAATWGQNGPQALQQSLQSALNDQNITLHGLSVTGTTARVRYTNRQFRSEAQAMGRVARILTRELPAGVETFVLEPMQAGIPLSAGTFRRSDLERLENRADGANQLLSYGTITDAGPDAGLTPVPSDRPAFTWGLGPYAQLIVFNGNAPVQLDGGAELKLRYEVSPELILRGVARQSLRGARELADEFEQPNDYHNVRTDARFYGRDGNPVIQTLTLAHYSRPGPDLYGRVTLGYLEPMYGGASAELLWKPVDSRFALGAEVNYARQRDFDQLFGFQDFDTVTGHVSGYYSFSNGFHAQVDVGRYLAGDWGATFALDREFDNGWKVGAYFTLTDMPFEQYGEGSFDKGIRITVPHDFFLGNATREAETTRLSSLTRDGGARLNVDGRLYDIVRDGHSGGYLGNTWGRFWR